MVRLGIDYRLLASRENLVNRGIGRYTQQQLLNVLKLDETNEYLLLCPSICDLSLVLPEIRQALNVSVRHVPTSVDPPADDPYDRHGLLRRAADYQNWIHGLGIDVYHATAPFVLEQIALVAFDACPTVSTVYDLIPMVFPAAYLGDHRLRRAYAGAAELVTTARRVLAISDGTRDDVVFYLGMGRDRIDCAWPFADACFRPLDEREVADTLRPVEQRVGLPVRFVLTVAAIHYSKNLELAFAAYARLSASFRRSLPLVVACHLDEGLATHVHRWAQSFGIADDVVLTGYVSDLELAALYNRALLVVHPSRYEGFGLPVVEAMQCGTAVVATTAPSLPEVTAGAAVLVDPDDATAMAAAIEGLSQDDAARARMGEMGLAQAAVFTPEALGRNTLDCYLRTHAGEHLAGDPGVRERPDVIRLRPAVGIVAPLGFNKLCEVEDFEDPDLATTLADLGRDVLAREPLAWAMAMSLRSLREFRICRPNARILIIGVGGAQLALYLTHEAGEVTAAGPWLEDDAAPLSRAMLIDPGLVATAAFNRTRLLVRHSRPGDPLPFSDATFDAVVSCRATEGLAPEAVARAAAETARVVTPGGIVALSTAVRLHGPSSATGLELDRAVTHLPRIAGLEPVDAVRTVVSEATMTARRDLSGAFGRSSASGSGDGPISVADGAVLGYLHLTMRKLGGSLSHGPQSQAGG